MNKPEFIVLGDAHLWPVLWQRMPDARQDAFFAAAQVLSYAVEHQVPVLSSGDIFNFGQRGGVASCLVFLQEWLPKVPDFRFIVGNHDLTGYTSGVGNEQWLESFRGLPNVRHLGLEPQALGPLTVSGIDYCHGRTEFLEKLNALKGYTQPDVLVLHQGLREILGFDGGWEVECADLEGMAKLVICGHTHVSWHKQVGDTLVLSPGSTVPWQMDEELEKKFPLITRSGKTGALGVKWQDIVQRREIWRESAMAPEEQDRILDKVRSWCPSEKLPEALRSPILRLRYLADEAFRIRLAEAAAGRVILDLSAVRAPDARSSADSEPGRPEDVDDILVATHKHTSPGRVRDAAIAIQRLKDPEGVIEKNINELLEGRE